MKRISVQKGNSKLGKAILTISFPAVLTCIPDAPCAKACYARKGAFCFPAVINCYRSNLDAFLSNTLFESYVSILEQIPVTTEYVRYFASGDIVNADFMRLMIMLSGARESTRFLAYTKKYEIVNRWIDDNGLLPSNLTIVFSHWDGLKMVNPYQLPIAYTRLHNSDNTDIPNGIFTCHGSCNECHTCWNLEYGECLCFNQH